MTKFHMQKYQSFPFFNFLTGMKLKLILGCPLISTVDWWSHQLDHVTFSQNRVWSVDYTLGTWPEWRCHLSSILFSRPITGPNFNFMPFEKVEIPVRGSVGYPSTCKNHVCKQNSKNKRIKYPKALYFSRRTQKQ